LDTHSFLWFISGNSNLSDTARSLIEDSTNYLLLRAAGIWEMAIKISPGKLKIAEPFEKLIPEQLRLNATNILFKGSLEPLPRRGLDVKSIGGSAHRTARAFGEFSLKKGQSGVSPAVST
jgi:hypothetical protein